MYIQNDKFHMPEHPSCKDKSSTDRTSTPSQTIQTRLNLFLQELRQSGLISLPIRSLASNTWEQKLEKVCLDFNTDRELSHQLLDERTWGRLVKEEVKKHVEETKVKDRIKTSFRIFYLYRARGTYALHNVHYINPTSIRHMYESNFDFLLQEVIKLGDNDLTDFLPGTQT
ncbi:hypothetical protein Glove_75g28 [Diversispora epigaea]|uniref:Uncharacterized protein n=1 Tax=Diversispora epigaea TaxID=1348612 RepID=A0A397J8W2_9GLOM|nr:hypothetical protein Glove_75g28 [Diversispora epigaea]